MREIPRSSSKDRPGARRRPGMAPSSRRGAAKVAHPRFEGLEDRCLLTVVGTRFSAAELSLLGLASQKTGGAASKVDPTLTDVYSQFQSGVAPSALRVGSGGSGPWSTTKPSGTSKAGGVNPDQVASYLPKLIQQGDRIVVDATATGSASALKSDLTRLGLTVTGVYGSTVSGWLPLSSIPSLSGLKSLRLVEPAYQPITNAGQVTSEGDLALRSNLARGSGNLDGSGVIVGVLSDSFNSGGGYSTDVATGDLPANIQILSDLGPNVGTDEGRAMAQIVHDVAPGSRLAFASASLGEGAYAQGIINLANVAGANVINDDVFYLDEPFFQDGIVAQAVNQVKSQGVSYFSSAGNFGHDAYESDFRDSGIFDNDTRLELNDFDPGPGVDTDQHFTVPFFGGFTMVLQWDQPFASATPGGAGSQNDVDVYLRDASGNVVAGGVNGNVGGDPVEIFSFTNFDPSNSDFYLQIGNYEGPLPGHLKYVLLNGGSTVDEYATNTGASYGHANAAGAAGVAAAPFFATPAYGVSPAVVEDFSSAGGTAFLFDTAGNRLPTPDLRQQPRITAIDGTSSTVPGFTPFFGTSAAAPHAAAVAALMLQANPSLKPDQVYSILQSTARDMDDPTTPGFDTGFDFSTGYGLIDAANAVASARSTTIYGHVFRDADNSGGIDQGDSAFAGVTVFLDTNNDGILNANEKKAVTDKQGFYTFTGLAAGTYNVRVMTPTGYVLTTSNAAYKAKIQPNQTFQADFGLSNAATIGGVVFRDFDGDGTREEGDDPLPGTLVYLDTNGNGIFDSGEAEVAGPSSVVSNADQFTFVPLTISGLTGSIFDVNLTIHLTFPGTNGVGFAVFLISPAGTVVEVAPEGAPGPGFFDTTFDDQASTIIFAGTPPYTGSFQPANPLSTFNGENANGVWTIAIGNAFVVGDGSLDSWSLDVQTATEPFTRTDEDGQYLFSNLPPGTYRVGAVPPDGLAASVPIPPLYTLSPGIGQGLRADFGFRPADAIVGTVVEDTNLNGAVDPGEPGLPGQFVYIDENGDGAYQGYRNFLNSDDVPLPIPPVGTGGSGDPSQDITFSTLVVSGVGTVSDLKVSLDLTHTYDGDLFIVLISPSGTQVVLSNLNGGSGADYTGTIFDDFAPASIGAGSAPFGGAFRPDEPLSTFLGEGADGTWTLAIVDAAEGDSGTLLGWGLSFNSPLEPSTVTDSLGRYAFNGLAPGSYTLAVQPTSGYSTSFPASGSQAVTLNAGGLAVAPFALVPVDTILGNVFRDLDGDATRDTGEPGLANVPVVLDGNGNGIYDGITDETSASYTGPDVDFGDAQPVIDVPVTIDTGGLYVGHVSVTINIDHDFLNDVVVTLISPSGTRVRLVANVLYIDGSFTDTTFDDDGATSIDDAAPNFTGTFRPEQPLSTLIGEAADGQWTLEVEDTAFFDDGVFHNWTLNVGTSADGLTTTDSQGNYSFTGVAPGSYNVLVLPPTGLVPNGPPSGIIPVTLAEGGATVANFSLQDVQPPQIVDIIAHWGAQSLSILNLDRDLPWTTLSSIDVVFSEDVAVDPSFFSLVGTKLGHYDLTVTYDKATHTATLRIPPTTVFGLDQVTLRILSDPASMTGVQDNPGGLVPGNFLSGGTFSRTFKILPGDVDGSGAVNVIDALAIRTDIALGDYFIFADLDGDGALDVSDFDNARKRNGTKI